MYIIDSYLTNRISNDLIIKPFSRVSMFVRPMFEKQNIRTRKLWTSWEPLTENFCHAWWILAAKREGV